MEHLVPTIYWRSGGCQANMMQRGTPTSFAGFSNIVGVSNMYDYAPFRPDYGKTILYDQVNMQFS